MPEFGVWKALGDADQWNSRSSPCVELEVTNKRSHLVMQILLFCQ